MAAFNFPNSPSVNDLHTENGVTFKWNGTIWLRVGTNDIIEEGNTKAEVIDTGSDGRFIVTTEGTERLRITPGGQVHVGNATNNANNNALFKAVADDGEAADLYVGQFINLEATAGQSFGVNIQAGSNTSDHGLRVKNRAGSADQFLVRGDGKVGIGTNNPNTKLDIFSPPLNATTVNTTTCKQLGLWVNPAGTGNNTTGNIYNGIALSDGFAGLYGYDAGASAATGLGFFTGNASAVAERLRITSGGDVQVRSRGSSASGAPFYVAVTGKSSITYGGGQDDTACLRIVDNGSTNSYYHGIELRAKQGGDARIYAQDKGNDKVDLVFGIDNSGITEALRITSSGFIGAGTASPNHMLQLHRSGSDNSYTQYTNATTGSASGDGVWLGMGSDEICYLWQQENNHMVLGTNNTERMRLTSSGRVEIGSGNPGNYGTDPRTLNLGSRANNVAGSFAIARGEAIGGGTGPYMELVHGPDGGTQRIHSIYSYVGDLRIVADSNENMELHTGGSSTVKITSAKNIGINCTDPDSALEIRSTAGSYTPILKISNHHSGAYAGGIKFESYYGGTAYQTGAIYGYGGSGNTDGMLAFQTRTTERMRIDKDGNVTKVSNPSFAAYRAQSSWNVSGNAEMVFNATRHNIGSHYNTSTGRFTAPVAGNYLFCLFIIYTGNYNSAYIRMFKNGARQYGSDIHFTHADNGSHWDNIAYSQVFNLAATDYISVFNGNSAVNYHGNHWMMFSGYLLG